MVRPKAAAAAGALWLGAVCLAGEGTDKTLTIGDKAPQFEIAHWLKGDHLEAFEPATSTCWSSGRPGALPAAPASPTSASSRGSCRTTT